MKNSAPIAVLGAGSWGTALALQLARTGQQVRLWEFDQELVHELLKDRANNRYLPGISFPENIEIFPDVIAAIASVRDILLVVPSHAFHHVLSIIKPHLEPQARIAWGTKGLSPDGRLLHNVVDDILGPCSMAVLSGPTFAKEVAQGLPTAITVASNQNDFAKDMAQRLHGPSFRAYTNNDLIGVQVGGAVKNVLAIAAGIADGMQYGANARCALITRGLVEITRLGVVLGGKQDTFMGLAGLGDLVLTCTDNQSRNRRFGLAIGGGKTQQQALAEIGQVVEGLPAAQSTYELAQQHGVEMPIAEQVYNILYHDVSVEDAVRTLLTRTLKAENL